MKKIPTLFERKFENHNVVSISDSVTPGMEWVLNGEGDATIKYDGSCCAFINGKFYKRYDAKKAKNGKYKIPPKGAIPCCDPDPITGHWPHWVAVYEDKPEDKWFVKALMNSWDSINRYPDIDGTYEAIGPHFQGNPYNIDNDILIKHGEDKIYLTDRSFESIKEYLKNGAIEGIVFWKDGQPQCKIKRTDFGFDWPIANEGGEN